MRVIIKIFFLLVAAGFFVSLSSQKMANLKRLTPQSFMPKTQSPFSLPLTAGTYSVGSGGYFPSIESAFSKLSTDGVSGNVTLELVDNLYSAPTDSTGFFLNGPIPGAGQNSRVTIRPAANKNVTVEGSSMAVFYLMNTSFVTFDGVSLTGSTTLTIHSYFNANYIFNDCLDIFNNSDHNEIINITFISEDITRPSGFGFSTYPGSTEAPDSNLIQNNYVMRAGCALFAAGYVDAVAVGNIIRENKIGSETDSLIAWGIECEFAQNTIVENNIIQNLKRTNNWYFYAVPGINAYSCSCSIIRNNVIHNLKSNAGNLCTGITLSGWEGEIGSNNLVYNNMIYDIQSSSDFEGNRVTGIDVWFQDNPKIYFNTVYLTGEGTNPWGSAALCIFMESSNVDLRNNILVNLRDETPKIACAIYDYKSSNLSSNYNNLKFHFNLCNWLIRIGADSLYNDLGEWQTTGNDFHSISEIPRFVFPDLHINVNVISNIESHAITIEGITNDIDGNLRSPTKPDIGADEFDGITGIFEGTEVMPSEFKLDQNYPNPFNPMTKIKYSIPNVVTHLTVSVQLKVYDVLGREVRTLIDKEEDAGYHSVDFSAGDGSAFGGNASSLPSGVYFYQLKAGNYIETKKMILLR